MNRDVRFHASRSFAVGETFSAKPRPGVKSENQRTRTIVGFFDCEDGDIVEPMVVVRNKNGSVESLRLTNFARWAGEKVGA